VKTFRRLGVDFRENRWLFAGGLAALLVVDVLQLFIPRVIRAAVDSLTQGTATSRGLLTYGGQILLLAVGIGLFRYVWRYLLLGAARRVERALRDRLFNHLQGLSRSFFSRARTGDLMAYATNDIEAVRMAIALGIVFLADTVILGVLSLAFMVAIHPVLTLYAILPMPVITLITFFFARVVHSRFEAVQKTFASLTEKVRETLAGIRVVKAYVLEETETAGLSRLSCEYVRKNLDVTRVWGMFFPLLLLLSNLSLALVLYFVGRLAVIEAISTGDLVAFMSYLGLLSWPMMALGWAVNLIQRGAASMERLNRVLDEEPAIRDGAEAADWSLGKAPLAGEIEVKGLTFSPGGGDGFRLSNLFFTLKPGQRTVVVGRTGTGKTVLCDLLARLVDPPRNCVFIDGYEVHRIPMDVLRRSVGYVPQDSLLFSDTIRENIAFGKPDASEEEVARAARTAGLWDEISAFPVGLATMVGEKGVTLSGGQRQRVAIARVLLMDPPILILDDALSSVDIETEERILAGLEDVFEAKTSLLVTHRIAPLRRAERIIVLDEGRIVETGDHASLLARGGVYADLYRRIELEEELEKE
jgi:ATP-binding cassette subfamily B multidrug efflux pump